MSFKTFVLLIKQSAQDALIYRSEIYVQLVAWFISYLLYFYLWTAIFTTQENFGGYVVSSMLTYFFIVQVIRNLVFSHFGFIINRDILYGDMANMITKPTHIIPHYYALEIGKNAVRFFLSIFTNAFILLLFFKFFDFSTLSIGSVLLGLLAIIPAHFINFCCVSMVGTLAFYLTDANRLIFFYFAIITLTGGWVVPLDLFPETVQNVLAFTPFPYTFYFPVKLIQGTLTTSEIINGFTVQIAYCFILYLLFSFQMSRGVRRFEAVGR